MRSIVATRKQLLKTTYNKLADQTTLSSLPSPLANTKAFPTSLFSLSLFELRPTRQYSADIANRQRFVDAPLRRSALVTQKCFPMEIWLSNIKRDTFKSLRKNFPPDFILDVRLVSRGACSMMEQMWSFTISHFNSWPSFGRGHHTKKWG